MDGAAKVAAERFRNSSVDLLSSPSRTVRLLSYSASDSDTYVGGWFIRPRRGWGQGQ